MEAYIISTFRSAWAQSSPCDRLTLSVSAIRVSDKPTVSQCYSCFRQAHTQCCSCLRQAHCLTGLREAYVCPRLKEKNKAGPRFSEHALEPVDCNTSAPSHAHKHFTRITFSSLVFPNSLIAQAAVGFSY